MTTSSTKKTYKIYIDINNNNIDLINRMMQASKSFSGYDLGDSTFPIPKTNNCSECPTINSSDPPYPITGKYTGQPGSSTFQSSQSTGTLSFTDFPIPPGSFNRGWSDYKGSDNVSYSCPYCSDYYNTVGSTNSMVMNQTVNQNIGNFNTVTVNYHNNCNTDYENLNLDIQSEVNFPNNIIS